MKIEDSDLEESTSEFVAKAETESAPSPAQKSEDSLPSANGLSIRELRTLAINHRRLILGATIGAGILAGLISLFIPNQYTAVTTLLAPQQSTSLSSILNTQLGSLSSLGAMASGGLGLKDPNDVYISMLESRTVEDALVSQFNLAALYRARKLSQARLGLEKRSTILSTKTGLISISVEDRDPNRAADIANAYVQHLQSLTSTIAVTEAGRRRMFFEQQLQDAQTKLVEAEEKLKETQQQTGILQLDAQMRATIESVTQLKAEIAAREVELQVLGSYATAENPERVRAEEELSGLQRQLTLLENKPGGGKGDLQVPTSQIPSSGMAYLNQVRDVRYFETITELLAKQLEAAKLDEARQGSVLQVLDKATPADTKSSPKRLLIAAVAAFLGLFGSIVYLVASASPAS
jgi:uncharacterized protein involved in exopolysaccharide biosynthesis